MRTVFEVFDFFKNFINFKNLDFPKSFPPPHGWTLGSHSAPSAKSRVLESDVRPSTTGDGLWAYTTVVPELISTPGIDRGAP